MVAVKRSGLDRAAGTVSNMVQGDRTPFDREQNPVDPGRRRKAIAAW